MGFFTPKDGDIIKYVSPIHPLKWSRWRINGTNRICIDVGPHSSTKLGTIRSDLSVPFDDRNWSIEASPPPTATSANSTLSQSFVQSAQQHYMATKPQVSDETDKWQTWAHNAPGDCKCGIKRAQCEYHR